MNNKIEILHGHIVAKILEKEGAFPNNPDLPVLVYKGALFLHPSDEPTQIIELLKENSWSNGWVDSIYDYHHYHSNVHEVLGVFCGVADLQLGGPEGICVELNRGDVVVIPAGVVHKSLSQSHDFVCVGAYPRGMEYDMNYGTEDELISSEANIRKAPMPVMDPVFGEEGPLFQYWSEEFRNKPPYS